MLEHLAIIVVGILLRVVFSPFPDVTLERLSVSRHRRKVRFILSLVVDKAD